MLGATVCYWWALTLVQGWAKRKMESKRVFKAIYIAVQDQSFKLIIICRLSPVLPSSILNYLFATMGVKFFPMYTVATVLGILPLVILYSYIGSLASNLASAFGDEDANTTQTFILLAFFVVSTILLVIILGWIGKREIKKVLKKLDELEAAQISDEQIIQPADEETKLIV